MGNIIFVIAVFERRSFLTQPFKREFFLNYIHRQTIFCLNYASAWRPLYSVTNCVLHWQYTGRGFIIARRLAISRPIKKIAVLYRQLIAFKQIETSESWKKDCIRRKCFYVASLGYPYVTPRRVRRRAAIPSAFSLPSSCCDEFTASLHDVTRIVSKCGLHGTWVVCQRRIRTSSCSRRDYSQSAAIIIFKHLATLDTMKRKSWLPLMTMN